MQPVDVITVGNAFKNELVQAQKGKTTSLPFIRHSYSSSPQVAEGEVFQVIVIGGSVYKSALCRNVNSQIDIITLTEGKQPKFDTKDTFLSFITTLIDPQTTALAINMAYPLTPVTNGALLDGILAYATKEHTFTGLVGEQLGTTITKYMLATKGQKVKVAVANDTICLLLSGLVNRKYSEIAAGIVGTGMNFAIFLDENTMVNLEAANFDKFERSQAAKAVDAVSVKPGTSLSEKEVAGAYLHSVFNEEASQMEIDRRISAADELDILAKKDADPKVKKLARDVLSRSASLVASQIVGISLFSERDLTFVMEGSLFWKGWRYQQTVDKHIASCDHPHTISFTHIPHTGIYGAAKLLA